MVGWERKNLFCWKDVAKTKDIFILHLFQRGDSLEELFLIINLIQVQ